MGGGSSFSFFIIYLGLLGTGQPRRDIGNFTKCIKNHPCDVIKNEGDEGTSGKVEKEMDNPSQFMTSNG